MSKNKLYKNSDHLRSMVAVENYKNNPKGKIINQEYLLTMVKRYKFQVDNLKSRIARLEKDNNRYKTELKYSCDKNKYLKNELDYMNQFSTRGNQLLDGESIFDKTQVKKTNLSINNQPS